MRARRRISLSCSVFVSETELCEWSVLRLRVCALASSIESYNDFVPPLCPILDATAAARTTTELEIVNCDFKQRNGLNGRGEYTEKNKSKINAHRTQFVRPARLCVVA